MWVPKGYARQVGSFSRDAVSVLPFRTSLPYVGVRDNYRQNYDRLVEVKRAYDPDNLFHRNQNIAP